MLILRTVNCTCFVCVLCCHLHWTLYKSSFPLSVSHAFFYSLSLFIAHINYFCTRLEVLVGLTGDSSLLECHIRSLVEWCEWCPSFKESWFFHLKDAAVEEEESTWHKSECYIHNSVAYQTATSSFIITTSNQAPHNAHTAMPSLSHYPQVIVSPPFPAVCYP